MNRHAFLLAAGSRLVRFRLRYEPQSYMGFVFGAPSRFAAFLVLDEGGRYAGVECPLVSDLRGLRFEPYAPMWRRVVRLHDQRRPRRPRLDLSSAAGLLASVDRLGTAFEVHRQRVSSDTLLLGILDRTDARDAYLQCLAPGAVWETRPTRLALRDVTRVAFGTPYSNALSMAAPAPPALTHERGWVADGTAGVAKPTRA